VSNAAPRAKAKAAAKAAAVAAPAAAPPIDPAQLDLLARPGPDPATMAVIAAAAQLLWPVPSGPDAPSPVHDAWRFSGRWWAQPVTMRRARPWTRP
jgi:hypothetical protein